MERLQKRFALAFSPMFTALNTGLITFLGLSFLTVVGPRPSPYAWSGLLVFLLVGVVLQFGSKRVLFYRAYDTLGWSLASVIFATLAWGVTVSAWGQTDQLLAFVVISLMLLTFGGMVFFNYLHNPQRNRMPYGDVGKMNPSTGVIVEPKFMEVSPEVRTKSFGGLRTIARLSPLIAGTTMLLARSLPDSTAVLIFLPAGLMLSSITAFMAARFLSFTVSTVRWQRVHGKRIYVKR